MPVLSLACHLPHNTPHIPSRYNNEQTTKQTKAINNSYIYINISCKCDTNRAGHFTLDAYASRPVACVYVYAFYCYLSLQLWPNAVTNTTHTIKFICSLIARFMGPAWCPPGSFRPQMGPMLAPWTLLSGLPMWDPNGRPVVSYSLIYMRSRHPWITGQHGPLARYVKFRVVHAPGMPETFPPTTDLKRKPLVSDPDMHHGTCVTHVPWCMSGSLTRGGEENVPSIPGACATHNFTYLARGPLLTSVQWTCVGLSQTFTINLHHCTISRWWPFKMAIPV